MSPLAIAIIAYVGGALTVVAALWIGAAAKDRPRIHGGTINGYPVCPGCGVAMPPRYSVCHYRWCTEERAPSRWSVN